MVGRALGQQHPINDLYREKSHRIPTIRGSTLAQGEAAVVSLLQGCGFESPLFSVCGIDTCASKQMQEIIHYASILVMLHKKKKNLLITIKGTDAFHVLVTWPLIFIADTPFVHIVLQLCITQSKN